MESRGSLITRIRKIDGEIALLTQQVMAAPDGTLISRKGRNGEYRYYKKVQSHDGTAKEIYLGRNDRKETLAIAEKMLNEKKLKDLQKEKKLLHRLLSFRDEESANDTLLS